ncbi:aminodeoxychorismate/anthranilate synthase component II [Alkalibacillus silvisoli]|uniref:Aminodeoxychorismate/anthranilate synthase component II n=1 Tax=Alkalibacillus silvisoli TaxID=392823 RepID=A0ABN0ZLE1_9BACI
MILLIDHYDSFTYNLYQYLEECDESVIVRRHDQITRQEIEQMNVAAIVLSPGPGKPKDYPNSIKMIKDFYQEIPILGICLGHQMIGLAFGAEVKQAKTIMHGKRSLILHKGYGLFEYMSQPLEMMRYHSLVINEQTLPPYFKRLAIAMDDRELMAIQHDQHPLFGVQFHPESIGSKEGKNLLKRFINLMRKETNNATLPSKIT